MIRRKGPVEADFTEEDERILDAAWAKLDKKLKAEERQKEGKPKATRTVRKGEASKRCSGISRKTV